MKVQIKKIGNSTGLILPKDVLARLGLQQGDDVILSEGPDRTLTVSPYELDDDVTLQLARDAMREYRNTLKKLAE
ncbi:MAG: AbrB/MazE/SpoVT family DNA-binding domain-containing protein [Pseudomonadota bacterium]